MNTRLPWRDSCRYGKTWFSFTPAPSLRDCALAHPCAKASRFPVGGWGSSAYRGLTAQPGSGHAGKVLMEGSSKRAEAPDRRLARS